MRTPSSPRRYLSIWLRRLATDRITRRASEPTQASYSRLAQPNSPISNESEIGASLVVVHPLKSALRLAAVNDAAARLGLKIGMALADARAMYPSLTVAESDVEADRRLLAAVADWCDRYTPLVGIDAPDGIMLDVTGCAHLFGGETALARDIVQRLAAQGLCARAAIADTAGCAWGVARYGVSVIPAEREAREPESISISTDRDYGFRVRGLSPAPRNDENFGHVVVPSARMREALAPLPTAALRLAPEIVAALAEVGLKRVADLLDLPRAALAARFGEILICRLDQALGREDEPITPRLPVPSYMVEQPFAEPIALERDVLGTIERLAQRLGRAMEQRHAGARRLEAALFRTDGEVHRIEVGTSAPTRDAARVTRLFADRLAIADACDPGFGYDLVRLSALHAERCEPVQTGLATPDDTAEMFHLIDRLGARFGLRRVTRLVPQDTHIPEFAAAALPAHGVREFLPSPLWGGSDAKRPGWGSVSVSPNDPHPRPLPTRGRGVTHDTLVPMRPVRLFEKPEPIEAIAEVPDGPPVRFRWRRVLHEVAAAEGPERIAMEWWRDEEGRALTRDYFRVESSQGLRVWLYREGLYGRETPAPRWFLHGLFG